MSLRRCGELERGATPQGRRRCHPICGPARTAAAARPQPVPAAAEGREGAGIEPLPPYDLRHAFASLQVRAGLSIPELAEQFGQSPAMTLNTYAHVIRELTGEPVVSAQEQVEATRRKLPGRFRDADAGETDRA